MSVLTGFYAKTFREANLAIVVDAHANSDVPPHFKIKKISGKIITLEGQNGLIVQGDIKITKGIEYVGYLHFGAFEKHLAKNDKGTKYRVYPFKNNA